MSVKVRFIGAGNIVRAILAGVEKSGVYTPDQIGIFDVSEAVREDFQKQGYAVYSSIGELVKEAPVVVMAVTPQVIGSIMEEVKSTYTSDTVILSVAAGIGTDWFQKRLGDGCKAVRCMPTLTAQEGMGSFAVSRTANMSEKDFSEVDRFLSSCGIVEEIPESLMNEVVALNGSAPGYFYHMANVIVEEAVKMGFDKTTAMRLFAQTMKGSAETLLNSGMSGELLESKLRLPGGTTLAALDKMDELGFDTCLQEGVKACVNRCKELSQL